MTDPTTPPLWEADHPYYCSESNYYSNEPGQRYDSWAEFIAEWGTADKDYNLLFRWDWTRHDPADYLAADDPEAAAYPDEVLPEHDTLSLFYVLQRKGIFLCNEVAVTADDEPAVREFLAGYWAHMRLLWEPFT